MRFVRDCRPDLTSYCGVVGSGAWHAAGTQPGSVARVWGLDGTPRLGSFSKDYAGRTPISIPPCRLLLQGRSGATRTDLTLGMSHDIGVNNSGHAYQVNPTRLLFRRSVL